jgi:preprotein translocase subunit YajC
MDNIAAIIIVTILALAVIILLIRRNQKDKKKINPDATDVMEEQRIDNIRKQDHL